MTDRELLELAARAAGADHNGYRYGENGKEPLYGMPIEVDDGIEYRPWNPLTDDGDALRLAAALSLHIEWRLDRRVAVSPRDQVAEIYIMESSEEDRRGNLRLAIIRCAAEVQRQRENK